MYANYFGLNNDPFNPEWDSDFLYRTSHWVTVYESLCAQVASRKDTALLIGEQGLGKTLMLRELEACLLLDTEFIFIEVNSYRYENFIDTLLDELNLELSRGSLLQKMQSLNQYLLETSNLHIVIIIDDVDALPLDLLNNILLLSTPSSTEHASIQFVLSATAEFIPQMSAAKPKPLFFSSLLCFELDRLDSTEVKDYIDHRLSVAGCRNNELFSLDAISEIGRKSSGIPAVVDRICREALRTAENLHSLIVSEEMVDAVSIDKEPDRRSNNYDPVAYTDPAIPEAEDNHKARDDFLLTLSGGNSTLQSLRNRPLRAALAGLAVFIFAYSIWINTTSQLSSQTAHQTLNNCKSDDCNSYSGTIEFSSLEFHDTESEPAQNQQIAPIIELDSKMLSESFDEAEMPLVVNDPPKQEDLNQQPQSTPSQPINELMDSQPGFQARRFLEDLEIAGQQDDLDEVVRQAEIFSQAKFTSDAYLLYFYAARKNHPDAAFTLGQFNDPATFNLNPSIIDRPNVTQARKWYNIAESSGHPDASKSLRQLRQYIKDQANSGNQLSQLLKSSWD